MSSHTEPSEQTCQQRPSHALKPTRTHSACVHVIINAGMSSVSSDILARGGKVKFWKCEGGGGGGRGRSSPGAKQSMTSWKHAPLRN